MSLNKQLSIGFFSIMICVFCIMSLVATHNAREYVHQQLASHAQDTATSLGLSITPYVGNTQDLPIVDTMINAIFDNGFYSEISLVDANGNQIITKQSRTVIGDVPDWFTLLVPLSPYSAESTINDGWTIFGKLVIKSNPSNGYVQLWENITSSITLFFITCLVTYFLVLVLVKHLIRKPINDLVHQAQRISDKHFDIIENMPKSTEMRKIVAAINRMSEKLSSLFNTLVEQSEEYKNYAYTDQLTAIGNRRAFELTMKDLAASRDKYVDGGLFLIKATSLNEISNNLGRQAGDEYLLAMANTIQSIAVDCFSHFSLFRINGSEFAILTHDTEKTLSTDFMKQLTQSFKNIERDEHRNGFGHVGFASFFNQNSVNMVKQRADNALSVAFESPSNWAIFKDRFIDHSGSEWQNILAEVIEHKHIEFKFQKIFNSKTEQVEYTEALARRGSPDNQSEFIAGQLFAVATRQNMAVELDKVIVSNLFKKSIGTSYTVGLNLSRLSLLNIDFCNWFIQECERNEKVARRLLIEIPERALIHDIDHLVSLKNQLLPFGVKFTIEHFGAQLASITHIRAFMPNYLKIDGRFTRDINEEKDNQLFVSSLVNLANGLNIKLIAETVESKSELEWLCKAGVHSVQGYYLAIPSTEHSGQDHFNLN